jgi:bifunctional DNA-binding transcriptional regulator/antitoxin component of YhaV-PrlF toxin-antitoxin module
MELMKMDEKGRVRFSKKVRKMLKLKPKQLFTVEINENGVLLSRLSNPLPNNDRVLKDMVERPLQFKGRPLTKRLLDKLEEEAWSS